MFFIKRETAFVLLQIGNPCPIQVKNLVAYL